MVIETEETQEIMGDTWNEINAHRRSASGQIVG